MNRKLNREGNLLMEMFPNFNSHGRYNGVQRYFVPGSGNQMTNMSGVHPEYAYDGMGGQVRMFRDANGKLIKSSEIITDKKRVGGK
jgi:hypothetical protein